MYYMYRILLDGVKHMGKKKAEGYHIDRKYDDTIAETLKGLDNKVHYKLYILYANNPHYSQTKIAKDMGVSREQFADYIRTSADAQNPIKPNTPTILSLFRLCIAKNIPLCYFLDNNSDYMEKPEECSIQGNDTDYVEAVNKELVPYLINKVAFRKDRLNEKHLIDCFLHDTGIIGSKFQYMTPAALEEFTQYVKKGLQDILSDKRNIIEPVNPIDPDDLEE